MNTTPHYVLALDSVSKSYQSGSTRLTVLNQVSFSVHAGETVAIVGPSGSGKSTLLSVATGLETPDAGEITLLGKKLSSLSEDDRADIRNKEVGIIFQSFHLIQSLTAIENVLLPRELRGDFRGAGQEAAKLLERVGLSDRADHYPSQLSGGEQQRVAVARAFINKPKILFADEPTGSLDEENAAHVLDLLLALNREEGVALVVVTHNKELAARMQRIVTLKSGRVVGGA